jgi:hypothetical protein
MAFSAHLKVRPFKANGSLGANVRIFPLSSLLACHLPL